MEKVQNHSVDHLLHHDVAGEVLLEGGVRGQPPRENCHDFLQSPLVGQFLVKGKVLLPCLDNELFEHS